MTVSPELEVHLFLIAGLGNPGLRYRHNRHNVGFMVVDRLAARLGETFSRLESRALVTKCTHQGHRLLLAKPQTYMNISGQSIAALVRFYKIPYQNLLVVYDDIDLPLGTLRLRPSGSSAGQKGMQSTLERLATEDIPRLRVGIGRPPGRQEAGDHVLKNFSRQEAEILPIILDRAVDAILTFTSDGIERAMNLYNGEV